MSRPPDPESPDPNIPKGIQKAYNFNTRDGAHEEYPWRHGPHQLYEPISDGHGESSIQVMPSQLDPGFASGKHRHPFELEAFVVSEEAATAERPAGAVVLRCYYGELHYTICNIATEYVKVEDTSGAEHEIYPIAGQGAIPGISIVAPADFTLELVDEDNNFIGQTVQLKYAEWVGTESRTDDEGNPINDNANDPDEADQPYGSVYLKWTASETSVSGAELVLVHQGEDPETDDNIGALVKATEKLFRDKKTGDYYLLIGEHRNVNLEENEGATPIEQKIFDNVYWAATVVLGIEKDQTPSTSTPYDTPFIVITHTHTSSRLSHVVAIDRGGGPGGGGGGGIHDGPGGGGGLNLGGLHESSSSPGSIAQKPFKGGVNDKPPGKKVASPIVEQLERLGLDPNKASFQNKFKMQTSGLNYKADPEYGID